MTRTMRLDVSAQSLIPGDVFDGFVPMRVVRKWSVQIGMVVVIHVVWQHLDIDVQETVQYLPSRRFEIERPMTTERNQ